LLIGLAGAAVGVALNERTPTPLPILGSMPSFHLTNHNGKAVSSADWAGHVVIANFIFTRCTTVCPVATLKMKRILDSTPDSVQLLSLSVDPEYDTPRVLRAFRARFKISSSRWQFLTGSFAAIRQVVQQGFKIAMGVSNTDTNTDGESAPTIIHSSRFVLLDRVGRIRGYFDSNDPARIHALIATANQLTREPR